jgi:hypothetical protein
MTQNDPALVEELGRLHDAYERALAANDVDALSGYFWDSPHVVRYGVAEQLYGTDELRAYRQGHTPPFTDRRIVRRHITIFGSTFASVMSEIEMLIAGARRSSRQSQVWVLMPSVGWRIVAAHVSVPLTVARSGSPWGVYADAMAVTLGIPLAVDHRPGVVGNLERTATIAAKLLAFSVPDEAEPATVFTP